MRCSIEAINMLLPSLLDRRFHGKIKRKTDQIIGLSYVRQLGVPYCWPNLARFIGLEAFVDFMLITALGHLSVAVLTAVRAGTLSMYSST
jgi:hypothetical protein